MPKRTSSETGSTPSPRRPSGRPVCPFGAERKTPGVVCGALPAPISFHSVNFSSEAAALHCTSHTPCSMLQCDAPAPSRPSLATGVGLTVSPASASRRSRQTSFAPRTRKRRTEDEFVWKRRLGPCLHPAGGHGVHGERLTAGDALKGPFVLARLVLDRQSA